MVRLINQLVKRRNERLDPAALDCLLTLKIRDVDMDAEAEIKTKKKLDEKHKKRIVNLSKKEKKVIDVIVWSFTKFYKQSILNYNSNKVLTI